jgi:heme a synthase
VINVYKKLNYFNFILAIFIILWGAWVRLSGSGAGCGDHWPLCNGEVIPLNANIKTIIEYVHRLSSGIFGITIFWSVLIARKIFDKGFARNFAYASLFFTITEALIGAVLVKKGLVVDNDSSLRAWVIGFHLVNTFILLGSLVAQIYSTEAKSIKLREERSASTSLWLLGAGIFLVVGSTGAISALGNTLFPESSLIAGVLKDFDSNSHFLIRIRIFHPLFAIALFSIIQYLVYPLKSSVSKWLGVTSWVAVLFGAVNWFLLAPKWGALVHLFIADILWCLFVSCFLSIYFRKSQ